MLNLTRAHTAEDPLSNERGVFFYFAPKEDPLSNERGFFLLRPKEGSPLK